MAVGFAPGGGGVSQLFAKPTWQTGVPNKIPADGHRDVPDISLDASPYHDGILYCTQVLTAGSRTTYVSDCQANSFRLSDTRPGGQRRLPSCCRRNSFAARSFNGLLAIIGRKLGTGGGLGDINARALQIGSECIACASAFHDITTGNNQVPCTTGSTDCPTGSNPVIGYTAATGYDLATEIGFGAMPTTWRRLLPPW